MWENQNKQLEEKIIEKLKTVYDPEFPLTENSLRPRISFGRYVHPWIDLWCRFRGRKKNL